jgi:hypothetical protein
MTTFAQQLHHRSDMTSRAATTMPRSRWRKFDTRLRRYFTRPLRRVADRSAHRTHIVVSRGRFARAIGTRDHNVRVAIWLAGWHIEIYDELGGDARCFARHQTGRRIVGENIDKRAAFG